MSKNMINKVLEEFIKDQSKRLKPRTLREYESTIELFKHYLNGYTYQYLDEKDAELFDKLYKRGREFCEIFSADKISTAEISDFLDWFVIRKVMASQSELQTFGRVMKKLVKWLTEKGYMEAEKGESAHERAKELTRQLPQCEKLATLIYAYIKTHPVEDYTETWDSHFTIAKVEPEKLWLVDLVDDRSVGAVKVSRGISGACQVGWQICLLLGKTKEGWKMLESGNVYPE